MIEKPATKLKTVATSFLRGLVKGRRHRNIA
jgi:hypothetical protein